MNPSSNLPLALGLVLFSFFVASTLVVPFIDLLYKFRLTRRKEAPKKGKVPLFDKMHDVKAGTPVGGGILLVILITVIFAFMFPFANHMGVHVQSAHNLNTEIFVILFSFLVFGFLGFIDDVVKIFGKGRKGERMVGFGLAYGLSRKQKFGLQVIAAFIVSLVLYKHLGIHILHIPLVDWVWDMGIFYVPFATFVILSFVNAFNITDGLDGLATGLLIICLVAFGAITAGTLDTPLSIFISISIGALIAFLYFNVWPARLFMGDTGAMAFGSILAVIGLLTGSVVALLVIGGFFVAEIVSSAVQIMGWKILKRSILPIAPLHHALEAKGWEEPKIVMRAWLVGVVLAIFGIWLAII